MKTGIAFRFSYVQNNALASARAGKVKQKMPFGHGCYFEEIYKTAFLTCRSPFYQWCYGCASARP